MTKRIHASVPLGGGSLFGRLAGKRAAGAPRRLAPVPSAGVTREFKLRSKRGKLLLEISSRIL
jgi:hypothetical protein